MRYLILLAVTLLVTVPGIATMPPLDRDESRYVQATKQMLETGDYVDIRFQDQTRYKKPIGIYWLQSAAASAVGGGAEAPLWSYRLVSVAGALISVLATMWAGSRLFGPTAGFVAALALAGIFGLAFEARIAKTDAMLLAFCVLAQGALAQIYVAARNAIQPDRKLPWIFWTAQGLAILIKGPIAPLLSLLTIAALWFLDRDRGWLRRLNAGRGIALAALIVLPWLVAISWKSGGAFWAESVGRDLLGKVAEGQESHGAPPGYYVLTYGLYVWPFGPLFLAAGLVALNRMRADPRVLFLIAWYIPFWLFFELLPTKLPHYVLPAYPALALLLGWAMAEMVDISAAARKRWQDWLYWIAVAGQAIVSIAIAVLAIAGPIYLGGGLEPAGVVAAIVAIAAGYLGVPVGGRLALRRIAGSVALAAVTYGLFFGVLLPAMDRIWMTPRIVKAVEAHEPCTSSRLAAVHYHEPSLVFEAGTQTLLTDLDGALQHLAADPACALALVPAQDETRLREQLAAKGMQARSVARIDGINYSKGDWLSLHLVRVSE